MIEFAGLLQTGPPSIFNSNNPLTPVALSKTLLYQVVGLGFGSAFVYLFGFPWLKKHFDNLFVPFMEWETTRYASASVEFLFGYIPFLPLKRIRVIKMVRQIKPATSLGNYFVTRGTFYGYFLLRMSAMIIILQVLGSLLTAIGWRTPITLDNISYDLIFARVNSAPNAAHIDSYLGVCAVGVTVLLKYRKSFIQTAPEMVALIAAALTVAIHEGIWIIFYYGAYGRYLLDISLLPNIIVDVGFSGMCILFITAYRKYPLQILPLRTFLLPTIGYTIFIIEWFLVPHFVNPTFYSWLPISTLNNWKFGVGVFNETPWYNDPLTNASEVWGWLWLSVLMCIAIWRYKPK